MQQHIAFDRLAADSVPFRECSQQLLQARMRRVGGVWYWLPLHRHICAFYNIKKSQSPHVYQHCGLFVVSIATLNQHTIRHKTWRISWRTAYTLRAHKPVRHILQHENWIGYAQPASLIRAAQYCIQLALIKQEENSLALQIFDYARLIACWLIGAAFLSLLFFYSHKATKKP